MMGLINIFYKIFIKFSKDVNTHSFNDFYNQENDERKIAFCDELSFFKNHNTKQSNGIVLVQLVNNYEYVLKIAAFSNVISKKKNSEVHYYSSSWTKSIGWIDPNEKIYTLFNKMSIRKMYESFSGRELLCFNKINLKKDSKKTNKIIENILLSVNEPKDVLEIKLNDVLIGDLIYDTYLRYFGNYTLSDIKDPNLYKVIRAAVNIFIEFEKLINRKKINTIINTYTSYIEHGITTRLCLKYDINTYSLGSHNYVIQKLSKDYFYHEINHTLFDPDKIISKDNLDVVKHLFESRFNGVVDDALSYMKNSPFKKGLIDQFTLNKFSESKRNVIIYPHDFYDSPHINRLLPFSDLYVYIDSILKKLSSSDIETTYWLKLHPNATRDTNEITIDLVKKYNLNGNILVLDNSISNIQIIELKPDLIATCRGTVAIEMAYHNIPVLAFYDNLYSNFNFAHTSKSLSEYYGILKGEKPTHIDFDKEKILSFYYQCYFEKFEFVDRKIFDKIHKFEYDAFSDQFIEFLLENKNDYFCDKLIGFYKEAIKIIDKVETLN